MESIFEIVKEPFQKARIPSFAPIIDDKLISMEPIWFAVDKNNNIYYYKDFKGIFKFNKNGEDLLVRKFYVNFLGNNSKNDVFYAMGSKIIKIDFFDDGSYKEEVVFDLMKGRLLLVIDKDDCFVIRTNEMILRYDMESKKTTLLYRRKSSKEFINFVAVNSKNEIYFTRSRKLCKLKEDGMVEKISQCPGLLFIYFGSDDRLYCDNFSYYGILKTNYKEINERWKQRFELEAIKYYSKSDMSLRTFEGHEIYSVVHNKNDSYHYIVCFNGLIRIGEDQIVQLFPNDEEDTFCEYGYYYIDSQGFFCSIVGFIYQRFDLNLMKVVEEIEIKNDDIKKKEMFFGNCNPFCYYDGDFLHMIQLSRKMIHYRKLNDDLEVIEKKNYVNRVIGSDYGALCATHFVRLFVDNEGNKIITSEFLICIIKHDSDIVEPLAEYYKKFCPSYLLDGNGSNCSIGYIRSMICEPKSGDLIFIDSYRRLKPGFIRKISRDGYVSTLSPKSKFTHITMNTKGEIYVTTNSKLYRVTF